MRDGFESLLVKADSRAPYGGNVSSFCPDFSFIDYDSIRRDSRFGTSKT